MNEPALMDLLINYRNRIELLERKVMQLERDNNWATLTQEGAS